ncbi:hypothetical protein [Sphingomonas astaxanthinifaciens]|nr:hypothetical protein [Sphingomonas astaxanthinifaciens]
MAPRAWLARLGPLTILAALPAAAPAQSLAQAGNCRLEMVATPAQWQVADIDIFSDVPQRRSFDVEFVNSGATPCRVMLDASTQGAPFGLTANGLGKRTTYSLVELASGADLTPQGGSSKRSPRNLLTVPANGRTLARYEVEIAANFDHDGSFTQPLLLQAYDAGAGFAPLAERQVLLRADVASSATLALSGNFRRSGGIADVDLGELEPGEAKVPVIMHVRASRAYRIRTSSENGGRLVQSGTPWGISYKLSMDGQTVEPAGGTFRSSPGDIKRVDNMKLGFIITGSLDVAAGEYSDVVTLEVSVD